MRKKINLSVIIPIYNAELYLDISLESILKQSFSNFELICVNDGSKDKSLDILKKFSQQDSRLKIINQKNSGAAVARNKGLSIANGETIIILDADDIFKQNFFEIMYNQLIKSKAEIVICQFDIFDQNTNKKIFSRKLQNKDLSNKVFSSTFVRNRIFQITNAASWNKIFKKDFILKNKIVFQNLKIMNDLNFTFLSLALASKIKIIDDKLVTYRINTKVSQTDRINLKTFRAIKAFDILKSELKKRKLFSKFRFSFYIAKLESFLWLIKKTFLNSL